MENCSTVEITRIQEEVKNLMTIFLASQISNSLDVTVTVTVERDTLQSISGELANVINTSDTGILPNDLEDTINTTEIILRFGKCVVATYIVINKIYLMYI